MKTNIPHHIHTHEGARAKQISPYLQLRRTLMACLLWEDTFYEDGNSVADRLKYLAGKVTKEELLALAIEARTNFRLRHAPLLLMKEAVRLHKGAEVGRALTAVIQRADELTEFLSLYFLEGKRPLSAQVKRGLAAAFGKFDAYQFAKYNRAGKIKLRDVLRLCHAKPKNKTQELLFKQINENTLPTPKTWEVELSAGRDKREVFVELLTEKRLPYMALLRNLRNMYISEVPPVLVHKALYDGAKKSKALPFRYIAAARAAPFWEHVIEPAMLGALEGMAKLPGRTILVIDCSYSMRVQLSSKSEMCRLDAAIGLAILARELCTDLAIYAYGTITQPIRARRGFALRDEIMHANVGYSTNLGNCVRFLHYAELVAYDRLIVITDEQSRDPVPDPKGKGYVINVATYENGIGYGAWTHIDGFSEATLRYIQESEKEE